MAQGTPPVAVHLGPHRPTVRAVRRWCGAHRTDLGARGVHVRTSWAELRAAVPGFDWRSDAGRRRLRTHLEADGPVLFSSPALLGPAYVPRGGPLHPNARAGVDGVAAALADVPWTAHLTVSSHADVVTTAWVAGVRDGHGVDLETFRARLDPPSWVPLVEHLVAVLGADRVTVHDATGVRTAADRGVATAVVGRSVLTAALARLLADPADLPLADVPATADPHWSARQVEVALTALPYLRSYDEREALRRFVDRHVDDDGEPAWPLSPAVEAELAARDDADLAALRDLVEVR